MITGSGQKKSYIFRLFSGCNFFPLLAFTVNNYILYADSTEISGFSVLLCFCDLQFCHVDIVDILLMKGGSGCFK